MSEDRQMTVCPGVLRSWLWGVGSMGWLLLACPATPAVEPESIWLGQTCALSGSIQDFGIGLRTGLQVSLAEANAAGGVQGRRLELRTLDDGYDPVQAIDNVRRLLADEQILLLVGAMGSPTCKAMLPLLEERSFPLIGPFTGAEFLRQPFRPYIINLRPSYYQEMADLVNWLVRKQGYQRVACLYQNDEYGLTCREGVRKALAAAQMRPVAEAGYERNTTAVRSALLTIRRASPEAVILAAVQPAAVQFIRLARELGMESRMALSSGTSLTGFVEALGPAAEGCVFASLLPDPHSATLPVVRDYRAALKVHVPEAAPDLPSLEGYLCGRFIAQVLGQATGPPDRGQFVESIYRQRDFNLGGIPLQFGPGDNQGMTQVYLLTVRNGQLEALDE